MKFLEPMKDLVEYMINETLEIKNFNHKCYDSFF